MKYRRLLIGLLAVVVALWVILGEQMSGASVSAVVNAPVVTIRAPVAGQLEMPTRQLGARVAKGEVLADLQDPLVDRVRLNDLMMEVELEKAAVAQIAAQLAEICDIRDALAKRTSSLGSKREEELRTRLAHAEVRLAFLESGESLDDADDRQLLEAVAEETDRLPAEPRLASLVLDHARERVEILRIALRTAEEAAFFGDGDLFEQRLSQLEGEIATLSSRLTEAEARTAAVQVRADRERVRVNGLSGGELQSPVDGLYWDVLQADSVTVQRGDPLLRLVDCRATMVTLSVTERVFNTLTLGQPARFRLGGSSEIHEATISRLAGSGAETLYTNLAVAPSKKHLEGYDVTLIVPALQQIEAEGCLIGRTGRAFFAERPLDALRNLVR